MMPRDWASHDVAATEERQAGVEDQPPLVVRMSDFTSQPGEWMATARERPVLLLRHGRPVGLLRPGGPDEVAQRLEATVFARAAKDALAAGPAMLTRYGEPYQVVLEPVPQENFDGWVLAGSSDLLADLEKSRHQPARTSAEVAAELGLPLDAEFGDGE